MAWVGLIFVLATVNIWGSVSVMVMAYIGAGAWFYTGDAGEAPEAARRRPPAPRRPRPAAGRAARAAAGRDRAGRPAARAVGRDRPPTQQDRSAE